MSMGGRLSHLRIDVRGICRSLSKGSSTHIATRQMERLIFKLGDRSRKLLCRANRCVGHFHRHINVSHDRHELGYLLLFHGRLTGFIECHCRIRSVPMRGISATLVGSLRSCFTGRGNFGLGASTNCLSVLTSLLGSLRGQRVVSACPFVGRSVH